MDRILSPFFEDGERGERAEFSRAVRGNRNGLFLSASHQPSQQGDEEQNQENEEQNLGDACGCDRNPAESENRGNDRDDEESQRPSKHFDNPPSNHLTAGDSMDAVCPMLT